MTNGEISIRGMLGTAAGLGAYLISPKLEAGLHIAALLSGTAVSLVTIWTLIRKNRKL